LGAEEEGGEGLKASKAAAGGGGAEEEGKEEAKGSLLLTANGTAKGSWEDAGAEGDPNGSANGSEDDFDWAAGAAKGWLDDWEKPPKGSPKNGSGAGGEGSSNNSKEDCCAGLVGREEGGAAWVSDAEPKGSVKGSKEVEAGMEVGRPEEAMTAAAAAGAAEEEGEEYEAGRCDELFDSK
jgi:hypothetical protein